MMERCRVKDILSAGTIMPQGIPKRLEHEALRHGVRNFAPVWNKSARSTFVQGNRT